MTRYTVLSDDEGRPLVYITNIPEEDPTTRKLRLYQALEEKLRLKYVETAVRPAGKKLLPNKRGKR